MGGARVKVSNPDRVVFPDAGWTKETVVAYYATVGEAMLPHLGGAPLTLGRHRASRRPLHRSSPCRSGALDGHRLHRRP